MALKARAIRDEDKQQRGNAILDAADELFRSRPEGLASMDELAEASGVAKGTLYLYFPSKEEVLLALYERYMATFFEKLHLAVRSKRRFKLDDLLAISNTEILGNPVLLSLATHVTGLTERSVTAEAALAFKLRMRERLIAAGEALDAVFELPSGESTRLLYASYALGVGMWQLKGCLGTERYRHLVDPEVAAAFIKQYPQETDTAVRTLWASAIQNAGSRSQ